jgi:hypothetical protein
MSIDFRLSTEESCVKGGFGREAPAEPEPIEGNVINSSLCWSRTKRNYRTHPVSAYWRVILNCLHTILFAMSFEKTMMLRLPDKKQAPCIGDVIKIPIFGSSKT